MNVWNNDASALRYSEALLELQRSLEEYVNSIQQMNNAINKKTCNNDACNLFFKQQLQATVSAILDIQNIITDKLNLLTPTTDQQYSKIPAPGRKTKKLDYKINICRYHFRNLPHYRKITRYKTCNPAPPWISKKVH